MAKHIQVIYVSLFAIPLNLLICNFANASETELIDNDQSVTITTSVGIIGEVVQEVVGVKETHQSDSVSSDQEKGHQDPGNYITTNGLLEDGDSNKTFMMQADGFSANGRTVKNINGW